MGTQRDHDDAPFDPFADIRDRFERPPAAAPPPLPRRTGTRTPLAGTPAVTGAPPIAARHTDADPFQEPPDPRPPLAALPEERIEFLRSVVRQKDETLLRARAVYAERDQEVQQLRSLAETLQKQLEAALAQVAAAQQGSTQKVEELQSALELERSRSAQSAWRTQELEQELQAVEADRRDLAAALAEVEAKLPSLEAALEQQRKLTTEAEARLSTSNSMVPEMERQLAELTSVRAELQGSVAAIQEQYEAVTEENESLSGQVERLEQELSTLRAGGEGVAVEREMLRGELERVAKERDKLRDELKDLKDSARARDLLRSELENVVKERDTFRDDLRDVIRARDMLRGELENVVKEQEETRLRLMALEAERTADRPADDKRRAQAEARVAELEDEISRRIAEVERARSRAEEADARARDLDAALVVARGEVERAMSGASGIAEAIAERDKLRSDVAAMKKKAIAAENAIEAAAALKAKVARLEAQLKAKK